MNRIELTTRLISQKHYTTIAHEQYLSTLREYLPGSNLYMREVHFVAAANPDEAVSIADIATKLDVTGGAVSQIAARLEAKGYIKRERGIEDKRQTMVSLTTAGKELYGHHEEYDKASMGFISEMLGKFSMEDLEKFIEYEKICCKAFYTRTVSNL